MQSVKLKRLIWFTAAPVAGWRLYLWAAANEQRAEWAGSIWEYVAIGLAAIIVIHGSWRVVPLMLLGFGIAEAIGWSIFYSGQWYYPGADDVLFMSAFGCNIATLLAAGFLIAKPAQLPISRLQSLSSAVPVVCFHVALFLCGGFTAMVSTFAMTRMMPELVATAAGVISTVGICLIALIVRPRLMTEMP